ncbi:peroxiredoxin-like family protein [Microbulbifer hydrolyticus]|uniref:thioredoxin-dependent peroxiredoxin n=1 Tax=Microbulbifer hydrolyticus TaxID=48074 RepID=A0A6P1TE17_9GAMM|nr:peroxiredoxin-like family protein [Microbulbifer hydrolyticus]MBB5212107.1 peroxiredoxin [Microbulbifer hydrolyticus]QHQ39780.1 redoxin domain-containing protein [Microbulbifer hydrolyticus]
MKFALIAALVAIFSLSALAQDISLPENLPQLGETKNTDLGKVEVGLQAGDTPADFSVMNHKGKDVSLAALLKSNAPILVVFYRGGWCPYCNVQIRQLAEAWPEFEKRGVTPVLISVDKPDASAMAKATYEIPFPVLSDPELKAHEAFDVVVEIDDATAEKYKTYGIVLEDWSGKDHHKIAAPGIFLVGADGGVEWAHVSRDYKTRPSVEQLFGMLDARN